MVSKEIRVIRVCVVAVLVGVGLVCGQGSVAQQTGVHSLVPDSMLQSFRAETGCTGPVADRLSNMLLAEDVLAEGLRAKGEIDWLPAGKIAAVDYDRAAQAAAAKGCKDLARKWWNELVRTFPQDAYAEQRRSAQSGLSVLAPEIRADQ